MVDGKKHPKKLDSDGGSGIYVLELWKGFPMFIPISHYFQHSVRNSLLRFCVGTESKKAVVSPLSACCAFFKSRHHRCAVLPQGTEYGLCPCWTLAEPSVMHTVGKALDNRVPIHCCRVVCFSCVTKAICGITRDVTRNNIGHGYPCVVRGSEKGKKILYCSRLLG